MAQKEAVERSPKKLVSTPKKKLISHRISPVTTNKTRSQSGSAPTRKPVLFRSHIRLSGELRNDINKKWDDCWPVSTLRPLALIDLLCYLLFIKKLEEKRLITGSLTRISGTNTVCNELNWSSFRNLNDHDLHALFTSKDGVIDLIKHYGLTNLQYSQFLKEPLLLTPSVSLLFNVVNIIKIMEAERGTARVAIFEYLLNKAEIETQSGQVYAPDKVVKLVVELMQPSKHDTIWDPVAGNGSLLINSAKYIAMHKAGRGNSFTDDFFGDNYNGIECDPVQLRIAAMNMIINGIDDPRLGGVNSFGNSHINVCEQSTFVLSNLYFNGAYDRKTIAGKTLLVESGRSEIHFLNLILNKLKNGGRAAVIVPEYILSNFTAEMIAMRQRIIEDHNLAAVISLVNRSGSLFPGAGILIFSEITAGTNDKIWFCKMKANATKKKTSSTKMPGIGIQEHDDENEEMIDIIKRWKNLDKEIARERTDDSFYVPVEEIKKYNYTLCFNQYRKIEKENQSYLPAGIPIINRVGIPIFDKAIPGNVSLNHKPRLNIAYFKIPKQLRPDLKRASVELATQVTQGSKTFLIKLTNLTGKFTKGVTFSFHKHFRTGIIKFSPYLTPLLLVGVISMFFYFEVFRNNNYRQSIATTNINNLSQRNKSNQAINKEVNNSGEKPILSQEQIKAIIYDSTTDMQYDDQPADLTNLKEDSKDEVPSNDIADTVTVNNAAEPAGNETAESALSVKYTVRDTTFFHNQPDESSSRKSYLDPLKNNVLAPIRDKNGFIYIVYTNQYGRTSKGWINKKDLIQLR